jgi:hypothetical protein
MREIGMPNSSESGPESAAGRPLIRWKRVEVPSAIFFPGIIAWLGMPGNDKFILEPGQFFKEDILFLLLAVWSGDMGHHNNTVLEKSSVNPSAENPFVSCPARIIRFFLPR